MNSPFLESDVMDLHSATDLLQIEISDTQDHIRVDHAAMKQLARDVLRGEGVFSASVSIALVDNRTIHTLNRTHLGHDWPTDVITFALSEAGDDSLVAELVLSTQMAAETAQDVQADPQAELALYLVHGLLHLCGFDDRSDIDAARMRQREAFVLQRQGWVNTYDLTARKAQGEQGWGASTCPA